MTARRATAVAPPSRPTRQTWPRRVGAVALVAVLGVGLAACASGSSSDSSGSEAASAGDSDESFAEPAPSASDAAAPEAGQGVAGDVEAGALEPRRIRRGQVTVEVEDLTLSAARVRDLAAGLGGYVSDESISTAREDLASGGSDDGVAMPSVAVAPVDATSDESVPTSVPGEGRLVLRVPPAEMEAAMDGIAEIGEELTRWSGETDVERTLVDLESRIATQEQSVADIRALMDRATTLDEIVMLEAEVSERTAELESLKAQQESIAGEAALATVTAVLVTPSAQEVREEERSGFLGGLRGGVDALVGSVSVLLTVVGALLPFALVAALVGWPVSRVVRRRRAARAERAAQAPSYPPAFAYSGGPGQGPAQGPAAQGPTQGPAAQGPTQGPAAQGPTRPAPQKPGTPPTA